LRDETSSRLEECPLRRVIAADGAGSVLRRALVSDLEVPASEDLLKHGYKELRLPPGAGGTHRIEKQRAARVAARRLHADRAAESRWQLHGHAVPAASGEESFASLNEPGRIAQFFRRHFPTSARCCRR
jgi:kynurenine 3-monooxygenase